MKISLIGLAALLLPALASANDPKPYVVYQGRAVRSGAGPRPAAAAPAGGAQRSNTAAARGFSAFGSSAFRSGVSSGRSFARTAPSARAFRGSSHRRGIVGSTPVSTPAPAPSVSAPPAYAVPGAKILSEGQQPVYSQAAGGGTHSIEGGGFIAMDQAKAHDVGRAPGISWAPPDTPMSVSRSGGGSGASTNGSAPARGNSNGPAVNANDGSGERNNGATGFDPTF